jgi:hypothetical protein
MMFAKPQGRTVKSMPGLSLLEHKAEAATLTDTHSRVRREPARRGAFHVGRRKE